MKIIARKLGLLALLVALAPVGAALAQSGTPTTTGPTPSADPTQVPLDGGASLLLAGGVALGLKKLRARRRA
ncbi:PID-CTERM protein-sorting domain-containing protein [Hymenobacter cheonanensis]|uniref:PID-CTERM protein-sorting domain-containing protein n=1 Tax=Hymenobacter sp. CA2-7 TaxID=3063993 RepID=UPI002712DDBF|nr:hypothetical protein [Hymenobacter sp. CA2-7]MDO7884533.1 hypothetical protein [Hymenobacter sp. CA2-7]